MPGTRHLINVGYCYYSWTKEYTKNFYKPNLLWYWNNSKTDTLIILILLLGVKKNQTLEWLATCPKSQF